MKKDNINCDQACNENKVLMDGHFLLMLFVSIVSLYGIGLLSASAFNPILLVALAVITCIIIQRYIGIGYSTTFLGWKSGFVIILIIAAVLRSDIYPHMMGGQDQGLYTNYAEMMLKTGGLNFVDDFRTSLSSSLKKIYDNTEMASVPLIDSNSSLRTISFYPLHPMWMALFGSAFGLEYKTLSLLLFSLIYIWSGKLLAEEIFKSEKAGNLTALLLCINPVLVFFSKYPVTEMVALAFSLSGFLYLIRGIKEPLSKVKIANITLSLLCFSAFFFVRFQFLMYLPFFGLLIIGLFFFDRERYFNNGALPALIFICILFLFSLFWYYIFQRELFISMFAGHFHSLINRKVIIFAVIILAPIFLLLAYQIRPGARRKIMGASLISWFMSKSSTLLFFSMAVLLISMMLLYETASLTPFPWTLNTEDPFIFRYHSIYRYILFLSPFAFFALIYGSIDKVFREGLPSMLILFISTALLVTLLQPTIPYLYYYGRYLSGELLPYSLIAMGGILSIWLNNRRKLLAYIILSTTVCFYGFFLIPQFRFLESEPVSGFVDISSKIKDNDIVLAIGLDDRLLVPLRLSYNKKIYAVKDWDSSESFLINTLPELRTSALKQGGRLILVFHAESPYKIGSYLGRAVFKNSFLSNSEHIRSGVIQSQRPILGLLLPFSRIQKTEEWLMHDISSVNFKSLPHSGFCQESMDFSKSGNLKISGIQLAGFSHQEQNGRWTDGDAEIQCKLKPETYYSSLRIKVTPYISATNATRPITERNVSFTINGVVVTSVRFTRSNSNHDVLIPFNSLKNSTLKIGIKMHEAISPYEAGESGDKRKLGLYIRSFHLE